MGISNRIKGEEIIRFLLVDEFTNHKISVEENDFTFTMGGILFVFFSSLIFLFLFLQHRKNGEKVEELVKLNLNGPHNHFLGEYANIWELRDMTKTLKKTS
ncbi:unnamed protein product [Orchesella dallaii]|uniref:Uncharacterized protein n=1 Tax=Orchesella dallaii TaxID=48710 RepID=A0ABP1SAM2_9HEXA